MIDVKLFKTKLKRESNPELGQLQATTFSELSKALLRAQQCIEQTAYANARFDLEASAEYAYKLYLIGLEIEERNK